MVSIPSIDISRKSFLVASSVGSRSFVRKLGITCRSTLRHVLCVTYISSMFTVVIVVPSFIASVRHGCVIVVGSNLTTSRPLSPPAPPRNSRQTSSTSRQNDSISTTSFIASMTFIITPRNYAAPFVLSPLFLALQFPRPKHPVTWLLVGPLILITSCEGVALLLLFNAVPVYLTNVRGIRTAPSWPEKFMTCFPTCLACFCLSSCMLSATTFTMFLESRGRP